MTKELIINAVLAGFWAGLAAFSATQELSKTALFAAIAVAVRTAVGFLAAAVNKPIVVDQ